MFLVKHNDEVLARFASFENAKNEAKFASAKGGTVSWNGSKGGRIVSVWTGKTVKHITFVCGQPF